VRIFPESLRGAGEGQYPWDLKPDSVMTNTTVGTITQSPQGNVIKVSYKCRARQAGDGRRPR
jgi:hypothetical protein